MSGHLGCLPLAMYQSQQERHVYTFETGYVDNGIRTHYAPDRPMLQGSSAGYFDNTTGSEMGVFPVDLWVVGTMRYKFGELTITSASTLSVKCPLVLQLMEASTRIECIVISS
ncbi:hypothetical protein VPH35_120500 [Triticum aestivum]